MPSKDAILDMFDHLDRLGYRRPDGWARFSDKEGMMRVVLDWALVLNGVDDRDLYPAVVIHAQNRGGPFWPGAGEILALIPESGPPLLGWEAAWTRAVDGIAKKTRLRPPGLTPEEAEARSSAHFRYPVWRLADRDDEHEAAMAAIGGEAGWTSLCATGDDHMHYSGKRHGRSRGRHLDS
jgi:hypothetical protein